MAEVTHSSSALMNNNPYGLNNLDGNNEGTINYDAENSILYHNNTQSQLDIEPLPSTCSALSGDNFFSQPINLTEMSGSIYMIHQDNKSKIMNAAPINESRSSKQQLIYNNANNNSLSAIQNPILYQSQGLTPQSQPFLPSKINLSSHAQSIQPDFNAGTGGDTPEQIQCQGTFQDPEAGLPFAGDLFTGQLSDPGNYVSGISQAGTMTLNRIDALPWSGSSLCNAMYSSEQFNGNWSSSGNVQAVNDAQGDLSWVEQQISGIEPSQNANIAQGYTELRNTGLSCVEGAASAAGLAAAYAMKPTGWGAVSAVSSGINALGSGVSNLIGCYYGVSNMDINEQAALQDLTSSFAKTISFVLTQGMAGSPRSNLVDGPQAMASSNELASIPSKMGYLASFSILHEALSAPTLMPTHLT